MEHKKRKKIIIIIIFLVILLFGLWFFFAQKKTADKTITKIKNLFPFGKIDLPKTKNQQGGEEQEQQEQTKEEQTKPKKEVGPRLRQISDFPTGGFGPIVRVEKKDITDITINADGTKTEVNKTIEVQNNYVRYSSIDDSTFYEALVTPYEITKNYLLKNYIPNTEEALFSEDGNKVILRYWNTKERSAETYEGIISKIKMNIEKCPYDFSRPINIGDNNDNVFQLHEFLNKNPLTEIAKTETNSPGNETSLAVPATITAIKNFQSLYDLDIDGKLGPATQQKMLDICNEMQKKKAEEEFKKKKEKYEMKGFFLPQGIVSIDISPDSKRYFYIEKDKIGSVGILKSFIDDTKKTIFESTYQEWLTQWNNEKNIQLTTKASYASDGYTYGLNPDTKDYHKSFKQKKGLTTLVSPNNKKIFIHKIVNGEVHNSIFNKTTQKEREIFGIQTFPEKCTWTKNSKTLYCFVPHSLAYKDQYPDMWYKGMESYSDSLYKIDGIIGKATLVSDIPNEYQKDLDAFKVGIDKNGDYIYFIDKKTEFLWSYRLLNV